jgi:hypothetical protein
LLKGGWAKLIHYLYLIIIKTMKIILEPQESEEMFHNALCNGLSYISGYGLVLEADEQDYKAAKQSLKQKNPDQGICYEDVLLEVLRLGKSLSLIDEEGDGDNNSTISLSDVHERVSQTPIRFLTDMITENDDAETADVIIQTVFYQDIIFG